MNAINIMNLMAEAASGADAQQPSMLASVLSLLLPLAVMVLIFWLFIIRPEKKRNKEMQDMLNNIQVADKVVTTGGIIGRVLSVNEDTVLIETGSDRTKIRVIKSAIARNDTQHEAAEAAAAEVKKNKNGKKEIK
ncbi:MAG: preprotein translocase subunit YajC [Oscillospiraceae bacterium]